MSLVSAARLWALELLGAGRTAYLQMAEASLVPLPTTAKQLLQLGFQAAGVALFWPLAWIWVGHWLAGHVLTPLGWQPSVPPKHPKVVQLESALARANESTATLMLERDSARAAERNHSCQLRLLQEECNDKTLQVAKLRQALATKEMELKAYRQALGRDSAERMLPMQAITSAEDSPNLEPNTPEERVRRVSWPNEPPRPNPTMSPATSKASKSNSRKLQHNWDWHDLLGDMGAVTPSLSTDNMDTKLTTPTFQPPALEMDQSYSEAAPREYLDPISLSLIKDPVVTPAGVTYDRTSITAYIAANHCDPASGTPLQPTMLYPNLALRDLIQKFLVDAPPLSTTTSLSTPSTFDTPPGI